MLEMAVLAAFLAFCRIGACMMLMPGLGSARVPMQVRLFLAVSVSLALLVHLWEAIAPHVSRPPSELLLLRSEEHTSELQSRENLVCRLLLEKKNTYQTHPH